MKLKITKVGTTHKVGDIVDIKDDKIPAYLVNKVIVIDSNGSAIDPPKTETPAAETQSKGK
ncbi:Uncharacterised protein [Yersinia frederiksenii]|nr:Uncharacterised protein [Yersinia frederiksenii]